MKFIHPTADVSTKAIIGNKTKIWHQSQIREDVIIGEDCIIGKNVYIDFGVIIGDKVKIQNNCSIYHGAVIESGAFIGPHVVFTNDKYPRSINKKGQLKESKDWKVGKIKICIGASIGAGCIVLPDVTIGKYAMIGCGSVVTKDIPDYSLAYGNPAKCKGKVSKEGKQLFNTGTDC